MASNLKDHLTPSELSIKYPQTAQFGWTAASIGMMLNMGLLIGLRSTKEKRGMINESSFISLMEYYNIVNEAKRMRY